MSAKNERDQLNPPDRASSGSPEPFEAALAALLPRSPQLDRDRLMFLAGRAAASSLNGESKTVRRFRPAVYGLLTGAAAGLLIAVALRPAPGTVEKVVEKIVYLPAIQPEAIVQPNSREQNMANPLSVAAPLFVGDRTGADRHASSVPQSDASYLTLRDRVLAMGVESWPSGQSSKDSGASPAAYHDLLDSFLHGG